MPTPNPATVSELVAYLRTCNLPTLVVEGPDDMRIYRWVMQHLDLKPQEAALLPTGGRDKLLDVYETVTRERHKYARVPIIFIADQDMWVFTGTPKCYRGLICTKGYSIENDLYSFANLEMLQDSPDEVREHGQVLDVIIEWFAFEVQQYLAGKDSSVARELKDIVPRGMKKMDANFRQSRGFNPPQPFSIPSKIIHNQIKKEYRLKLRGKYLFDILVRFLNYEGRHTMHDRKSLQEAAFKRPDYSHLRDELINRIQDEFTEEKKRIASLAPRS